MGLCSVTTWFAVPTIILVFIPELQVDLEMQVYGLVEDKIKSTHSSQSRVGVLTCYLTCRISHSSWQAESLKLLKLCYDKVWPHTRTNIPATTSTPFWLLAKQHMWKVCLAVKVILMQPCQRTAPRGQADKDGKESLEMVFFLSLTSPHTAPHVRALQFTTDFRSPALCRCQPIPSFSRDEPSDSASHFYSCNPLSQSCDANIVQLQYWATRQTEAAPHGVSQGRITH